MQNRQKLRILYLVQGYATAGGHEAHLLYWATEMQRRGHEPQILVVDPLPAHPHRFMNELEKQGIPISSLGGDRRCRVGLCWLLSVVPWLAWRMVCGQPERPSRLRAYLQRRGEPSWLEQRLRRESVDVVHVLGRISQALWPVLPANRTILHHGTSGERDETWDDAEAAAFRSFSESCALNLAPGQGVINNLRAAFGIRSQVRILFTICPDTRPVRDAVDGTGRERRRDTVPSGGSQPRFGVLCRLTPEKGIEDLLEALTLYRDQRGDVHFRFYGSGVLKPRIRAAIEKDHLPHVTLTESFGSPGEALATLDCFVHPSVSDAMPMAIVEALMCGLPCIVTRVGGIGDLVRDNQEGFLIEPGNAEAICEAMMRFSDLTAERVALLGQQARRRYEETCRPEPIGDQLEQWYLEVLSA